jgi:hypothetical protein
MSKRGSQIVSKASWVLNLLLLANLAIAQNGHGAASRPVAIEEALTTSTELPARTAWPSSSKIPAGGPPRVTYVDGQLRIDALDATLADVLTRVGALTGVDIDIPAGADREKMHIVQVGPGPARQVLASLLSDSNFDYLIQASDKDPERIQNVLLMPREKKQGGGTNGMEATARPSRGPFARALTPPANSEVAPAPDPPVPAQPENTVAEANSLNPQSAPAQSDQATPVPITEPDRPTQFSLSQPDQSNLTRGATLTPPQDLSPQSINQQLQQMYQQRIQINQQGQSVLPAVRQ